MFPDTKSRFRRAAGPWRAPGLTLRRVLILWFVISAGAFRWTAAQELPRIVSDEATVELLTITPGDAVYSAFGHSALRIVDPVRGMDAVFNYGTFDSTDPWFIPKFAYGDMRYFLSAYGTQLALQGALRENRTVISQRLNLTSNEISDIYQRLLENLRPENRFYQYDFVRDNCSTRLLELIEFEQALVLPDSVGPRQTYRELIDGYVYDQDFLDLGIDLLFGARMDRIVFPRERAFLPIDLMNLMDVSRRADNNRPIVVSTDTVLVAGGLDRPFPPGQREPTWLTYLMWGLAGLGMLLSIVRRATGRDWTRFRNLGDRALLGIVGFIGLFLCFMWFGSKHTVTRENWNLAWALPMHLWPAIAGFGGWISRTYLKLVTFWTWGFLTVYMMDAWVLSFSVIPQVIPPAALPLAVLVAWRLARRAFPKRPASDMRIRYSVPERPQRPVNRATSLPGDV